MPPLSSPSPSLSCSIFHFIFSIFSVSRHTILGRYILPPTRPTFDILRFRSYPHFLRRVLQRLVPSFPFSNLFHNLNDHPVSSGVILTSRITVTTNRSSGADVASRALGCHRNAWSAFRGPIHPASSTAVVQLGLLTSTTPVKP